MAKLLIVDDEPTIVDMISTYMEINGYEWIGAYNGTDGLTMTQIEHPDMVILDRMMPDIDGTEVIRQLRDTPSFRETPILMISARTDEESIEEALAVGANAYLTKPLNLSELLGEVRRLVG